MKSLIKRILKEYINNSEEELNSLLDKISKYGINSLTPLERKKLEGCHNPKFDAKENLIDEIKYLVEKYGTYITMTDMQADSSPVYKSVNQEIHLSERLSTDSVNVGVYGGYKYETEMGKYEIPYEDLNEETLEEIKSLLDDAINSGLLEEDV